VNPKAASLTFGFNNKRFAKNENPILERQLRKNSHA